MESGNHHQMNAAWRCQRVLWLKRGEDGGRGLNTGTYGVGFQAFCRGRLGGCMGKVEKGGAGVLPGGGKGGAVWLRLGHNREFRRGGPGGQ
jgi:hypothetical protein